MNKPDVSVIVPVYNVESYLWSCLESLANQTLRTIEVIMVNDGATDNSPQIMQEFERKYPNFRIINRENGGLSAARNTGLQHAHGDYIGFVDSDDFVDHTMYETLFKTAENCEADIVKSGVLLFQHQTCEILDLRYIPEQQRIYDVSDEALTAFLEKKMNIVVVNALYKRSLFKDLNFKEGVKFEDHYFTPNALGRCSCFVQIDTIHYYYRKRKGSISYEVDTKGKADKVQSMNELYRVIQQTGNPGLFAELYSDYFMKMAVSYHNSLIYKDPLSLMRNRFALQSIIKPEVFRFIYDKGNLSAAKKREFLSMWRSHFIYFILQKTGRLRTLFVKEAKDSRQADTTDLEISEAKLQLYRSYLERYRNSAVKIG